MATKTREEIDALKESWMRDPCWDIEQSEGFEDHQEELLSFRMQKVAQWQSQAEEKRELRRRSFKLATGIDDQDLAEALSTYGEISWNLKALDSQIGDAGSAINWAEFVIAREQVRATLLLAAQVKHLTELFEGIIGPDGLITHGTTITRNPYIE
jgi:hypothetical protein